MGSICFVSGNPRRTTRTDVRQYARYATLETMLTATGKLIPVDGIDVELIEGLIEWISSCVADLYARICS